MARIEVISVTKKYRDSTAVDDVNMDVQDREFVVLLGPSGCGKSTLLKLVAGLEELTAGEIYIDGRLVNYVRPAQRDVAMVFQNYALYPHMTVAENIGFPLRMNRLPKSDVRAKVEGVARVLGIEELLRRRPEQLSGGQRQRVALGRAIIRKPKVFLMDEPLSNLDAKLRVQMREELMELHRRVEGTIIYVTHDQTEAMTMANRIVVLRDGRIQQTGRPQTVYDDPANTYVAAFVGSPAMNLINGELSRSSGELTFANGDVSVVVPRSYYDAASSYRDTAVTLGIRSEDVLADHAGGASMSAIVDFTESVGSDLFLKLRVGQSALMARTDARSKVVEGQRVGVEFRPSGIRLFDRMGDAFTRTWDAGGPQNASP